MGVLQRKHPVLEERGKLLIRIEMGTLVGAITPRQDIPRDESVETVVPKGEPFRGQDLRQLGCAGRASSGSS